MARSEDSAFHTRDLTELRIEDLMNTEVTSVSRKTEHLSDAAAAVFVLRNEDLQRLGVLSIQEALRYVPGLIVAQIDANKWSITSRGFGGRFANKMLVLIDGLSVYTPLFSGVFWQQLNPVVDNIDRIEVIRGPGASLWGANAVNGVINIVTKHARDTRGWYLKTGYGSEDRGFVSLRYGGCRNQRLDYQVHFRGINRDDLVDGSGHDNYDNWDYLGGGFRLDWQQSSSTALTLIGEITHSNARQVLKTLYQGIEAVALEAKTEYEQTDGMILGKWSHAASPESELMSQTYYHFSEFIDPTTTFRLHILDADIQHRFRLLPRHELVWGGNARLILCRNDGTFAVSLSDIDRTDYLYGAFVQDEIALVPDRLSLTAGSKFEYNSYTGFEYQPNVRLCWHPHERHSLWAAVSRAVRTPSISEVGIRFNQMVLPPNPLDPDSLPMLLIMKGNADYQSEILIAYECGYRVQPTSSFSLDLALFFNDYDRLRDFVMGEMFVEVEPGPTHLVLPFQAENPVAGETYGGELAATLDVAPWWRVRSTYSHIKINLWLKRPSVVSDYQTIEGESPQNQVSLRSSVDITPSLTCDLMMRYVDGLAKLDIDEYTSVNARIAWHVNRPITVSVVGNNLFEKQHQEYSPDYVETFSSEIQRSITGAIEIRF
ncbi:MAG: TonB-dependent receptor [candidate division Zixibacteria bacterium]|nr:TonB-dependent receptor [candidate division Zixibacteria bacterium]